MFEINSLTARIFKEFSGSKSPVAVYSEGEILVIKVGGGETRLMNWRTMTQEEVVRIAKGLVLKEGTSGPVLLNE
jgi:hypothetical protein